MPPRLLIRVALAAVGFCGSSLAYPLHAQEARSGVAIARPSGKTYPRISLADGYESDSSWPHASHKETAWGAMAGVAVDPQGRVWTFNRGPKPVQVFEADGTLVRVWDQAAKHAPDRIEFREPHQIRFDRIGGKIMAIG